jgi:hypothetical protein
MDLNPFDDIVDFLSQTKDAIKQIVKSGGIGNAVRDTTNAAIINSPTSPRVAAAAEIIPQSYKIIRDKAQTTFKVADAVATGGEFEPAIRFAAAEGDPEARRKALQDLAIATGLNLAFFGGGKVVGAGFKAGLNTLAKRKAAQELSNIIGFHHSWTPGLSIINPSVAQRGTFGATAADQIPGYSYLWAGDYPNKGVDAASGLPWSEIASRFMGDKNQLSLMKLMAINGLDIPTDAAGFIPRVRPFEQSAINEVPAQFKRKAEQFMSPSRFDQGSTYIVKAPPGTLSMDENLFTQMGVNLFDEGLPATSLKNKGPLQVLDEIPTGPIDPLLKFGGMDPNTLLDSYLNQVLLQEGRGANILAKGASQAELSKENIKKLSLLLARLNAMNNDR